jgi:hypothetical protein
MRYGASIKNDFFVSYYLLHLIKNMKKSIIALCICVLTTTAFSQTITDTAAFIAKAGASDFIMLDGKVVNNNFGAEFGKSFFNQKIVLSGNDNQPFMLLSLPVNGSHSPALGTYNIMSGKKLAVKKGSQIAKIDMKPNYISLDDSGTLFIFEFNGLHWFIAENISIIDTNKNETHKMSFKIGMYIAKS